MAKIDKRVMKVASKILEALENVSHQGVSISRERQKDGDQYSFGDNRYRVTITINPERWFGLEFIMLGTKIIYSINTDLYSPTSPKNEKFVEDIGEDIADFLCALSAERIKIAYEGGRTMLIIPLKDSYILLKEGRVFSSATSYATAEKLNSKGNFKPFALKF